MRPPQINNCDFGLMNEGRRAERFPALKMREIRFVLINMAEYTTEKQRPIPAFCAPQIKMVGFCTKNNVIL
ncbi:hypothetical protein BLA29_006570 [Euroglyphus maynei]|uniref:Uncharacterized protein n=1 Tax=Euroglyphus maynei TaxID=6958 RepID=A0A1Y3AQ68_EURMA|nr:hypothetical protein BLA29_006570 [Euroglyphus maynei]